MSKADILERAVRHGIKGITSDDAGVYTCHGCGSQWQRYNRYLWWPVSLRWSWPTPGWWFTSHGAQVGYDGIEQRVFARYVRVGPIIIGFGAPPAPSSSAGTATNEKGKDDGR